MLRRKGVEHSGPAGGGRRRGEGRVRGRDSAAASAAGVMRVKDRRGTCRPLTWRGHHETEGPPRVSRRHRDHRIRLRLGRRGAAAAARRPGEHFGRQRRGRGGHVERGGEVAPPHAVVNPKVNVVPRLVSFSWDSVHKTVIRGSLARGGLPWIGRPSGRRFPNQPRRAPNQPRRAPNQPRRAPIPPHANAHRTTVGGFGRI
jgi:hypothetical protein